MERIQSLDHVILRPNVANDEAYHIIVRCIKIYVRALKLVSSYIQSDPWEIAEFRRLFFLSMTLDEILRLLCQQFHQKLVTDLDLCYIFLWRYIKDHHYAGNPEDNDRFNNY